MGRADSRLSPLPAVGHPLRDPVFDPQIPQVAAFAPVVEQHLGFQQAGAFDHVAGRAVVGQLVERVEASGDTLVYERHGLDFLASGHY